MLESKYQARLISTLKEEFPGCMVLKNDSGYIQGIPDLLILFGDMWAALEVKASKASPVRPNQIHYVRRLHEQGFAAFVHPESEAVVLEALRDYFGRK